MHIPKCAGVSVCQSLFGNLGAGHYRLKTFQKVFGQPDYEEYFKFSFVRNPWDRLLSAYFFLRQGGFNSADQRWAEQHLSGYRDFGAFVRNWVTPDNIRSWVHFQPQIDYLLGPEGELDTDFIGRFENLEADFKQVCDRLGIQRRLSSFNTNSQGKQSYTDFYDDETRELVADVYRQDVIRLGYSYEESYPPEEHRGRTTVSH